MREEAGELCQTLEAGEGPERAASEAADLLYHSMVLLNLQVHKPQFGPGPPHSLVLSFRHPVVAPHEWEA